MDHIPAHKSAHLNCGHAFGRSCIIEWGKEQQKCPLCKQASFPNELLANSLKTLAHRQVVRIFSFGKHFAINFAIAATGNWFIFGYNDFTCFYKVTFTSLLSSITTQWLEWYYGE